jgi:hypothetical protein
MTVASHHETFAVEFDMLKPSELPVGSRLEAGRLFEDIQERGRAVDSVALRIAYSFYDPRTFQSFDGALRGRKRDR